MKKTALKIVALTICLSVTAGIAVESLADELENFNTRDLENHLRKTSKELKTMKNLEKKLTSAARQSSNTARKTAISNLREHMGQCILRRENDLGQDHTIKMHGKEVTSGTTAAAEVGTPVGTSRAKTSLNFKEGLAGLRLRQLSRMQSIYVSAIQNEQPAIERQGDSLDRYTTQVRRFREELERSKSILDAELEKRAREQELKKEQEKGEYPPGLFLTLKRRRPPYGRPSACCRVRSRSGPNVPPPVCIHPPDPGQRARGHPCSDSRAPLRSGMFAGDGHPRRRCHR